MYENANNTSSYVRCTHEEELIGGVTVVLRSECLDKSELISLRYFPETRTPSWHTRALKLKPNSGWPWIQLNRWSARILPCWYDIAVLDSVTTIACAGSYGAIGVYLREVLQDVFPTGLEIYVYHQRVRHEDKLNSC